MSIHAGGLVAALLPPVAVFAAYGGLVIMFAWRFTLCPATEAALPATPASGAVGRPVGCRSRDGRARIAGTYYAAQAPLGAVVLVHGRGGSRQHPLWEQVSALVGRLVEGGYSVLAIDLRGHGQSSRLRTSFGVHERHDVLGAVDWLLAQGHAAGSIGLVGASMGGAAAIAAAAEEPAIGAVVTDSTFADFVTVARNVFRQALPFPGAMLLFGGVLKVAAWLTGARLERFAPARLASALNQPLLVVHSAGDPLVPLRHALALAEAARTTPWITDSEGHVASFLAFPGEYIARVTGFFEGHLRHGRREAPVAPLRAGSS